MTAMAIVVGALGTVSKSMGKGLKELEIKEIIDTIKTTALLRSTRIQKRVQEIYKDYLLFRLQ